jgi:hypothetical protein
MHQIGSSARVCATLNWIPALARLVWPPFGLQRSATPSTPTLTVIFAPKHHRPTRSSRSAIQDVEIAFFFYLCLLCFSGFTLTMSNNRREGGTIYRIHVQPSLSDGRHVQGLHTMLCNLFFFKLV